jgi:thiol-disulfide isomerase/thioredoxin
MPLDCRLQLDHRLQFDWRSALHPRSRPLPIYQEQIMSHAFRPFAVGLISVLALVGCKKSADETGATDTETAADYVIDTGSKEEPAGEKSAPPTGDSWENDQDEAVVQTDSDNVEGDTVTDLEPETPTLETYVGRIEESLQAGNVDDAVAIAKEAHANLPEDPRTVALMVNFGMLVARMGDFDRAVNMLEGMTESVTDPNVRMGLMQLYQQQSQTASDPAEALAKIQKATAIVRELGQEKPWAGEFFYDEAVLTAKAGQAERSLELLREAFESGYAELAAPLAEEAFANNPAAAAIIEEFAARIRERYRAEIREEMVATESFPFSFELTSVVGEPVSTAGLKGKVAIVDFWGTWCPPCRMEIPHFVQLGNAYSNDLTIVGLNYQEPGDTDAEQATHIAEFMTANEMNYQCAVGNDATIEQVPNLEGFPTTLFLDRTGKVRLKLVGYHPYEKLEAAVMELAAEEAPAAEDAAEEAESDEDKASS